MAYRISKFDHENIAKTFLVFFPFDFTPCEDHE